MRITLGEHSAAVPTSAFVAPGAFLVGAVTLGEQAGIWYSAVPRGDGDAIRIGARSNIQDTAVVHTDPGFPVRVPPAAPKLAAAAREGHGRSPA
jgi:carbonic anhydrase/acetyltransferase-like protein (isoleucine patch superfamily)